MGVTRPLGSVGAQKGKEITEPLNTGFVCRKMFAIEKLSEGC